MRRCKVLLIYFVVAGLYTLCEGLKKGDPGVCESQIPKIYSKSARVRCSRGYCYRRLTEMKRIISLTCCTHWEFDGDKNICQPICIPGCVNGYCGSPGVCACDPPLVLHNSTTCRLPICDPPCFNGACIADDSCSCNSELVPINNTHCGPICETGYHLDSTTLECRPTCENPCLNGTCSAPNTCTCNEGFKMNDDTTQCIFKCEPDCLNGICVRTNICECLPGYIGDIESRCKPVCDNCLNGVCVAPEICVCREGYLRVDGKCTPHCSGGCINGFCARPDTCACDPGYKFDAYKNCIPTCDPDCVNGICSFPNKCSCYEGYIKINSSCSPRCDNCEYGKCIEPNICQCDEGYVLNNGSCLPVCKQTCKNGYCSEPDVCVCKDGYKSTAETKHVCEPVCDKPCVNSTCVAPNTCKCLLGFKPANSSYECAPECDSCVNGSCIAPEVCSCDKGYTLVNGSCVPKCEIPCINGYCYLPNECDCEEGYVPDEIKSHICYTICDDGRRCTDDACCERGPVECTTCEGSCVDGICACANTNIPCYISGSDLQVTNTSLAGIHLTWILAAAVGFLLIIALTAVIFRMQRKRTYETKTPEGNVYGSVVYTAPEMLITRRSAGLVTDSKENSLKQTTTQPLLLGAVEVQPTEVPID